METQPSTLYADKNNIVLFICVSCGFEKKIDVTKFLSNKITIKCKCGKRYTQNIEVRQFIRKNIGVFGTVIIKKENTKHDIIIKDISQPGLGFEFAFGAQRLLKKLTPGNKLFIEFELDNAKQTIIKKNCVVASIRNSIVGVLFVDDNFAKEIGFYLMNN